CAPGVHAHVKVRTYQRPRRCGKVARVDMDRFAGLAKHDQTQMLVTLVRRARESDVELPPDLLSAAPTVESAAALWWSRLAGVPFDGLPEPGRFSEWQTERLDLEGYLRRIGMAGRPDPTLGSLRALLH